MAQSENKINITIDGQTMSATLADNEATKALIEKLTEAPITITMHNYGGFEKVGELPWSLPTSDTRLTTSPGDIMLYMGDNIVIFYGSNTWSYTPLGSLETTDPNVISKFVGNGNKDVTISLANTTDIENIDVEESNKDRMYSLDGKEVTNCQASPGIYIKNKKKVLIK